MKLCQLSATSGNSPRHQGQLCARSKAKIAFSVTLLTLLLMVVSNPRANEATIVEATINHAGSDHKFRIDVTIAHADEGWDHYANRWEVLDENGELLGTRVLHHPHVNEQPFTRSLSLTIPPGVKTVTIVASDSVHEDNPETLQIEVPGR